MHDDELADRLASLLESRTARGLAIETSALIRSGALPVGTRLPTVRALAFALGISPATLSDAWRDLRRQKMITGRGRNGAWVSGNTVASAPSRMVSVGAYHDNVVNLSLAVPDPALLPDLRAAFAHAVRAKGLNSYERTPILDELREAIRPRWPYQAETYLATNGGYNAVYAALHALVLPGSSIAIEQPTGMRLLDIIEDLGGHVIPVASDGEGPIPASLAAALERRPTAFIFQPRTHSVTGITLSAARLAALGDVLEGSETIILEDDGVGDASPSAPASLGDRFPDRVVHILSFSKSLGPDLRLAVLSGPAMMTRQIQSYRSFSAGWTSRILQAATAWLLNDEETAKTVAAAQATYRDRRQRLERALGQRGMVLPRGEGLCIWVPVAHEQYALVTLAARGIAVVPGAKFAIGATNHIRVGTSMLASGHDKVADTIMLAAMVPS